MSLTTARRSTSTGNPSQRHLVWVDRQGHETELPGDGDSILKATVSRDGTPRGLRRQQRRRSGSWIS